MTDQEVMLARVDGATRTLAEIRSVGEAKELVDQAEAARVWAKMARLGLEAQNHAAEIKLRAERRAGELLPEAGIGRGIKSVTLTDFGIDENQSRRWQSLARLQPSVFEGYIAITVAQGRELTTGGALQLAAEHARTAGGDAPVLKRPISVVETDQAALVTLLDLHRSGDRVVDVSYGRGHMWDDVQPKPYRLDRDPELHALGFTDGVADWAALPFDAGSWDVVVYDPPHVVDGDRNVMAHPYGLGGLELDAPNITALFAPFLCEAGRVLARGGLILAKIADQIHSGAYQPQHVAFIAQAQALELELVDIMIRVAWNRGNLNDPKWQSVQHVRQVHSYWLAFRVGG